MIGELALELTRLAKSFHEETQRFAVTAVQADRKPEPSSMLGVSRRAAELISSLHRLRIAAKVIENKCNKAIINTSE